MATGALLFDLDGTLVDSAADIARALSTVSIERGGQTIMSTTVRPLVSLGATTLVRRALGPVAGDESDDLAAFRTVLASLPPDPTIVFDGVREALGALSAAGFAMAIVTNKPESLSRQLLRALALDHYFGAIIGGDSAAVSKPSRTPLDMALRQLGKSTDGAMMIGDSAVDAEAAQACGVPFILYMGGYDAAGCSNWPVAARFGDFGQLQSLIEGLVVDVTFPCVPGT